MLSIRSIFSIITLLYIRRVTSVFGLSAPNTQRVEQNISRRAFLSTSAATAFFTAIQPVSARYILNEETGEYDEVTDEDWQTTWSKRLDKAKTMSNEDIFLGM